jgi:ATP-binding cassette subfamily F protein 3
LHGLDLHLERGDRIALVGPNGAGKSTLMRMLSGEEPPDVGRRVVGHNVVMQYFAQDEATRMEPALTVYETLASGSPMHMVAAIRNLLGGFLFSGDDVYKRVKVLSGGERTRLAVARMLLRPSNTLLLDEPTNHLDLDSKEVLLDALNSYGGTLIFVSHDRYFVESLATKIIEVGHGTATVYPGTYAEFLWHKDHPDGHVEPPLPTSKSRTTAKSARPNPAQDHTRTERPAKPAPAVGRQPDLAQKPTIDTSSRDVKKRADADLRRRAKAEQAKRTAIERLEAKIADAEQAIKDIEQTMLAPGFYEDRGASQTVVDRHHALMWQVGDLMRQWEELQSADDQALTSDTQ